MSERYISAFGLDGTATLLNGIHFPRKSKKSERMAGTDLAVMIAVEISIFTMLYILARLME